ncbi:MAG: DUF4185 domain-containing protein [Defluviitaleaceae bacterium]|nr:DUF4185 domain-containing protein [Defluviitaleaceae bacterium]
MQKIIFPKSKIIKGLAWLGEHIPYPEEEIKGDTYPMTWADDDRIYTSSGDPHWGDSKDGLDIEAIDGGPEDYKITQLNGMTAYTGFGGLGPKPTGMICVNKNLYFAFQNFCGMQIPPITCASQHGSDAVIIVSNQVSSPWKGLVWTPIHANIKEPTFPGYLFGGPAFINHGKNNENARDDYVYAVSGDQWDNGSNLRLGRVPNDSITRGDAWEWVCSFDICGNPAWTRDLQQAIPILSLHRSLGLPEMVYLAGIKRYLLFTWRLHKDFSPYDGTDLIVFESPEPWGPFSLVHYEEYWQGKDFNPYCPRLPLKWFNQDKCEGWLQFSGSWRPFEEGNPYYRSNVRPFRLDMY